MITRNITQRPECHTCGRAAPVRIGVGDEVRELGAGDSWVFNLPQQSEPVEQSHLSDEEGPTVAAAFDMRSSTSTAGSRTDVPGLPGPGFRS